MLHQLLFMVPERGNGVIQITTKQGKEGRTRFSLNHFTGVKSAKKSDAYDFSVEDWAAKELAANGSISDKQRRNN